MRPDRLSERILRGDTANVDFDDLVRLLVALGFARSAEGAVTGCSLETMCPN
jgi:hypothetical protein